MMSNLNRRIKFLEGHLPPITKASDRARYSVEEIAVMSDEQLVRAYQKLAREAVAYLPIDRREVEKYRAMPAEQLHRLLEEKLSGPL